MLNAFLLNEWKHRGLACAGGKSPAEALFYNSHCFDVSYHYSYIVAVISEVRSCVVQEEKEDRSEMPTPLSCLPPLQVGQRELGQFFLPPPSSQSQPANWSRGKQKREVLRGTGSAILRITSFWGPCLPRLSQPDVPLACRNLAGFREIRSIWPLIPQM